MKPRSEMDAIHDPELAHQSREVLADGGRNKLMLRPLRGEEEEAFPQLIEEAAGCELKDSTGRTFVDWTSAFGPMILGYRRPEVEAAIREQLSAGPMLPLMHSVELEVASMLTEMIPCAEMVGFGKNGSDAVTAAVRIARAATGREVILQHGKHGFNDWIACQHRSAVVKGIPKVLRAYVHRFPYGNLDALEQLFAQHREEVAAIVMEPLTFDLPEPGYLEGVRELTRRHGALLVFDEMVTGFRLANGGAQEFFGVTPDLACFGKALSNGMPLSAIVGRREYMRHLPNVAFSMTYRGETLSLAAARAVLRILRAEPVVEHIARVGTQVREAFDRDCEREGVRCRLVGPPARMAVTFEEGVAAQRLQSLFMKECARHGVLTHGTLLPSYAHDQPAVERSVEAFQKALRAAAEIARASANATHEAFQSALVDGPSPDSGDGRQPGAIPGGALDRTFEKGTALEVTGWTLLPQGCPDGVDFVGPGGERWQGRRVIRPDLAEAFPGIPGAENGGFSVSLPADVFARDRDYEFTIEAGRSDGTALRLPVVHPRGLLPSSDRTPSWSDGILYV